MSGDTFRPFGDSIAVLGLEDGRHAAHTDCFADEVVIDFPSVAPVIERIRRAFVDDDKGDALRREITLTAVQAAEGVTVPLDVPVRALCRQCGGRGETWNQPCTRCSSTGSELLRHQVQILVPAGVNDGASFRFLVASRHHPPTRIELYVAVR